MPYGVKLLATDTAPLSLYSCVYEILRKPGGVLVFECTVFSSPTPYIGARRVVTYNSFDRREYRYDLKGTPCANVVDGEHARCVG